MGNNYTPASAKSILDRQNQIGQAAIFEGGTQKPFEIQQVTIALDSDTTPGKGNAFKIGFPFKSVFVQAATDTATSVNLQPNSQDSYQSGVPLHLNDSFVLSEQVANAYLTWAAQPGKSITLFFFVNSEFRSGSQLSISGGGTSISEGSAFSTGQVTLAAATATQVLAQNGLRKVGTFENTSSGDVWVGTAAVTNSGANIGIKVASGNIFVWKNTAALYAYSALGGTVTKLEET